MARASTPTLLALDRYSRIIGITPPHFNQGESSTVFPLTGSCSGIWFQYQWQSPNLVSREELARAIYDAEEDIARELGYYPAPKFIGQEQHRFPRHHRRDVYRYGGLNVRDQRVSLRTRYGKFISSGQRGTTLIGTATTAGGTLVYDLAVQTLTATITLPTTLTDECEIKAYFANQSAAPEWEIRPPKSVTISGGNVVMVFDSWLFIDPDLWEEYPTSTAGLSAIDFTNSSNLVTSVEVYREFNDYTQTGATFFWEPTPSNLGLGSVCCTSCGGTGCTACALTSQNGCLHVRDVENGIVVPTPASYDADNEVWTQDSYTECRDPDMVRIFYYAGDYSNRWRLGNVCETLSDYWAHAIAWLATSRLERPFCGCNNVETLVDHLREDLAFIKDSSYQFDPTLLVNPFGTRRGAVMAWQRVNTIAGRQLKGGAI